MRLLPLCLIAATLVGLGGANCLSYEPEYALDKSELSSEYSVRILKPGIPGSRVVEQGDRVKVLLRSFSPAVQKHISGFAQQTFEVGKHPVTPLNEAIVNMRIDEIRRVGVSFGDYGKLYYENDPRVIKMDMDLQSLQLKAVSEMLQLSGDDDTDGQQLKTWKVLIYDDEARKLLSPILKVGELRSLGVTLNMAIGERREPIPGVDAVYLVSPTAANLDAILEDARARNYKQMYINFTTYTSDAFLSEFARKFVEANAHSSIAAVTDRYIHFASITPCAFSLNMPRCFAEFYGGRTEDDADALMDTLVDRLLSVFATLGTLPVIVAPRIMSSAATVAERLNKRLFDLVSARHQLGITLASSFNRPMLFIVDRTVDLGSMIQHSWNYQALLHDVFGISFDKVVLEAGGEKAKKTTYDLESSDKLYQAIHRLPLSDVASHIASSLEAYNAQVSQINRGDGEAADSLVSAMNAIPHLTEQKRLLDMHTNLATALVDAVRGRELDRFYEFEYDVDLLSEKQCFQRFEDLLASDKATAGDLYRSLLLVALNRPGVGEARLDELENRIKLRGPLKAESLRGLRNVMKMKAFGEGLLAQIQNAKTADLSTARQINEGGAAADLPRREISQGHKKLAEYSSKLIDTGVSLFKGVRRLLPRKKQHCIVSVLENLLSNVDAVSEEFAYYDPKTSESVLAPSVRRATARRCVVFVVGGGSYNEAAMLQELAARTKYSILYGSTDFDRPEDFVEQLGASAFAL